MNYYGNPDFQPIQGTTLTYAVNTATPVIYVPGTAYYAVQNGVWFTSALPNGPWAAATSVPPAIYSIPPSSALHYVTYVYVYGSTPNVVYVGYTPGYYGTVVSSSGVVVYGTGYYYSPYVTTYAWVRLRTLTESERASLGARPPDGRWALAWAWPSAHGAVHGGAPWEAGDGAITAHRHGAGAATEAQQRRTFTVIGATQPMPATRAAWANPYTGNVGTGGRGAYYNPVTGNSGYAAHAQNYNAYTGNYSSGSRVSGYNPTTGNRYAGGAGSVSNAYTGNYAAGARGMDYNQNTGVVRGGAAGTYGNAYTGQSVSGAHGFAYNTNTGNGVGHYDNNTYADHDGNVYKYNPSSGWQQHTSSGWSQPSSSFNRSDADNWASARDSGAGRWGNFHSGGVGRLRRRRLG